MRSRRYGCQTHRDGLGTLGNPDIACFLRGRQPFQEVDPQACFEATANGADRWREIPDVRPFDWRSDDEHRAGSMNGVIVAQAPIRSRCDDAIPTLNGPKSEGLEHIALHATKGINDAELLMPKGRLEGWRAVCPIVQAILFHCFR